MHSLSFTGNTKYRDYIKWWTRFHLTEVTTYEWEVKHQREEKLYLLAEIGISKPSHHMHHLESMTQPMSVVVDACGKVFQSI